MAWLALTVIAALVATGLLVTATGNPQKRLFVMGAFATVGLWLVITLFGFTFATIGAGHLGLVKTFSDYTGVMDPGFNTKAPWQSVDEVNVKIQSKRVVMDGQEGRGSAVSRETQPVYAIVTLNYSIVPAAALELYRNVGKAYYDSIIAPRVAQVFKAETVRYSTIEVAPNREKIRADVLRILDDQLEQYGINVTDFLINDLDFAEAFVNAITEKQVATQQAEAARAKVQQSKAEADQRIEQARGEGESVKIAAAAEAEALALKGTALRQNPEVLQLSAIEKLNPNVQTIYLPSGEFILNLPRPGAGQATGQAIEPTEQP
jgi:regulator of protease activity HflC (stomatin/prohibitin superfamily)